MIFSSFIFTQTRIGKNGQAFTIYKFRTMYQDAEKDQAKLHHLNEGIAPTFKIKNDPRLTSVGKFLRKTGLDELPQLINVIKGDMAFIGPRPLPVSEANKLPYSWKKIRESVKPGIISSWVLEGGHNVSQEQWIKLDKKDVKNLHSFTYHCSLYLKLMKFLLNQIIS